MLVQVRAVCVSGVHRGDPGATVRWDDHVCEGERGVDGERAAGQAEER